MAEPPEAPERDAKGFGTFSSASTQIVVQPQQNQQPGAGEAGVFSASG